MRLRHFCIGSTRTQDLLISKTFLPLSSPEDQRDIQKVWATFLDLFQAEHKWTPLSPPTSQQQPQQPSSTSRTQPKNPSSSSPSSSSKSSPPSRRSAQSSAGMMATGRLDGNPLSSSQSNVTTTSATTTTTTTASTIIHMPLFSTDTCFIYRTVNDLVLVACCPLPPDPSKDSMSVTRIPTTLSQPSSTSTSQSPQDQPPLSKRPDLAFSTAAGLHTSLHGMIEFLIQLIKALERFLKPAASTGATSSSTTGGSSTSRRPSTTGQQASDSASEPVSILSSESIRRNSGVVYEVLDECMVMGFPMMPSLAQLDLLVFGVAK